MSVDASSVALANALIRPVKSAADTLVAHSANSAVDQRSDGKTSTRRTKLRRNLPVDQSNVAFRVAHYKGIMSRGEDGDATLFVRSL